MKLHTSGHYSDYLHLSWWDLVKLAAGCTLRTAGIVVKRTPQPTVAPTNEARYRGI
jgi:hypothetical protein